MWSITLSSFNIVANRYVVWPNCQTRIPWLKLSISTIRFFSPICQSFVICLLSRLSYMFMYAVNIVITENYFRLISYSAVFYALLWSSNRNLCWVAPTPLPPHHKGWGWFKSYSLNFPFKIFVPLVRHHKRRTELTIKLRSLSINPS